MAADAVGEVQGIQQFQEVLDLLPVVGQRIGGGAEVLLMGDVKMPGQAVEILAIAVPQKDEPVPGDIAEDRIGGMGSLAVDQLAGHAAEIDGHSSVENKIRRLYADLGSVRVFAPDHGGAKFDILPAFPPGCHRFIVPGPLCHFPEPHIRLAACDDRGLPVGRAEAMVPVPVGQGNEIGHGKSGLPKFLLQELYVGPGVSCVKEQRSPFTPDVADVGPVGVMLIFANVNVVGDFSEHGPTPLFFRHYITAGPPPQAAWAKSRA